MAKRALLGEKGNEAFGPLIGGPKFTIRGLEISGEELIGRLWIFASTLKASDQENAKQSMISALTDSIRQDENGKNQRVCHLGKTQRLLIGVLQGPGRFKGVNIDDIAGVTTVRTTDALNLFFSNETNQQIADWDGLRNAANTFLEAHNLVNRDEFMAGIREYAVNK